MALHSNELRTELSKSVPEGCLAVSAADATAAAEIQKAIDAFARPKTRTTYAQVARAAVQLIETRSGAPLPLLLVGLGMKGLDENPEGTCTFEDQDGRFVLAKDCKAGSKELRQFAKLGGAVAKLKGEGDPVKLEVLVYKEGEGRFQLGAEGEEPDEDEALHRGVLALLRFPPLDISRTGEFFQKLTQHHREHPEIATMDTEKATPVDWFLISFLADDAFPLSPSASFDDYRAYFRPHGPAALRVFRIVWAMMGMPPAAEEAEDAEEEEEAEDDDEDETGKEGEGGPSGEGSKRQRTE